MSAAEFRTGSFEVVAELPRWLRAFLLLSTACFISFMIYLPAIHPGGSSLLRCWRYIAIILIYVPAISIAMRFLFYNVTASPHGLESKNLFGGVSLMPWGDVAEIRRSRLSGLRFVVSRNGGKVWLIGDTANYERLIEAIREKVENLQGSRH